MINELLFYGGMIIIGISLVLSVVFSVLFKYRNAKLHRRLDEEYGKPQNKQ